MHVICNHQLTKAESRVLCEVEGYLIAFAGDTGWTATTSPIGDGREVPVNEIYPSGSNVNSANRRTLWRLYKLGILRACEIELVSGMLKGRPL